MPAIKIPASLSKIKLVAGCGTGREGDRCAIQEYRAWRALDPSVDTRPKGVCPILHRLVIGFNDSRLGWRALLVVWLPNLTGSEGNAATRQARAYKAADWAVRVFAPITLDARGFPKQAATLRALASITNRTTCNAAYAAVADAADAAVAAAAYAADKIDIIGMLDSILATKGKA